MAISDLSNSLLTAMLNIGTCFVLWEITAKNSNQPSPPEQAELFEKYYTATNEMNSVSETAAFKFGFNLAVWLLTESA